jgi:16S rRNA G966 N2-methylase RsmD
MAAAELAKQLRDITLDDALQAYEDLKAVPCKNPGFSRIGLKALDYFFLKHRIKAKTRSHISFSNAMRNEDLKGKLNELAVRYKKTTSMTDLSDAEKAKLRYSTFQLYYGTINQFKPTIARWVYCTLKPKKGILDFSAGWGGRCLAAMSMGIPYVGIDANKELEGTYREMVKAYDPAADVTLVFKPSETVDFGKYTYDLVFTSPPYFMIEEYERMPQYGSKEGFLQKFFRPVVKNAWMHLAPGGHMALNMPHEMYMAIRDLLPPVKKRMVLPLSNRHPTNAKRGRTLGTERERHELIYVWHKGAGAQRGTKRVRKGAKAAATRKTKRV